MRPARAGPRQDGHEGNPTCPVGALPYGRTYGHLLAVALHLVAVALADPAVRRRERVLVGLLLHLLRHLAELGLDLRLAAVAMDDIERDRGAGLDHRERVAELAAVAHRRAVDAGDHVAF